MWKLFSFLWGKLLLSSLTKLNTFNLLLYVLSFLLLTVTYWHITKRHVAKLQSKMWQFNGNLSSPRTVIKAWYSVTHCASQSPHFSLCLLHVSTYVDNSLFKWNVNFYSLSSQLVFVLTGENVNKTVPREKSCFAISLLLGVENMIRIFLTWCYRLYSNCLARDSSTVICIHSVSALSLRRASEGLLEDINMKLLLVPLANT